MVGKLTNIEISNILSSVDIGRIAFKVGRKPYIIPVTFSYDGAYIYTQMNQNNKLKLLRKNPKVCFQVDRSTNMRNWQSVIVFGKAESFESRKPVEPEDITLEQRTLKRLVEKSVGDISESLGAIFRIRIKKATGRFEKE